ncbi:hypothetical protein FKG94_03055 [Exilibacterium tricleocarpae]|uniref:Uncharacterized protein n=1 Tax=Exilibacterium tricleocarpae TaxID=2591008 RepID=A0A545U6T6_9GAMM|nr:hypothetical protein [Exilibacterium tricleocarpae]TQV85182.1 hypothetical protein FKG94_03055 [Exilibacterium tricleocarpae]
MEMYQFEIVGWQLDLLHNNPVALVSVRGTYAEPLSPLDVVKVLDGDHRVFVAGYLQAVSDTHHARVDVGSVFSRLFELLGIDPGTLN